MNAHITENEQMPSEEETLSSLIDLLGMMDGQFQEEDFKEEKEAIMQSGITSKDLMNVLTDRLSEAMFQREIINIDFQKLSEDAILPTYAHESDACADIYAAEDVTIGPNQTVCVGTGLAFAIPQGFVCHIYARSGLSAKTPLRLANSVGVIDAGYRDEIKVPLWNSSFKPYHVEKGMRIAQMDVMASPAMDFYETDDVKSIEGDRLGGFGSSGFFEMNTQDDSNE